MLPGSKSRACGHAHGGRFEGGCSSTREPEQGDPGSEREEPEEVPRAALGLFLLLLASFLDFARFARSAFRFAYDPADRSVSIGFRPARPLP